MGLAVIIICDRCSKQEQIDSKDLEGHKWAYDYRHPKKWEVICSRCLKEYCTMCEEIDSFTSRAKVNFYTEGGK